MKRRILIAATAAVMILGMVITGCSANAPHSSAENYDSSYKNDGPDSFGIGYGMTAHQNLTTLIALMSRR